MSRHGSIVSTGATNPTQHDDNQEPAGIFYGFKVLAAGSVEIAFAAKDGKTEGTTVTVSGATANSEHFRGVACWSIKATGTDLLDSQIVIFP